MKLLRTILLFSSVAFLSGCSDSTVVLQASSGGKKLVYDSNNFRPQVETTEDIGILVQAATETLGAAVADQSLVTVTEIQDSMVKQDWRKLERAVVNYRGTHKKK